MDMYQRKINEFVSHCGSYSGAAVLASQRSGLPVNADDVKKLCAGAHVDKDTKLAVYRTAARDQSVSIDPY